MNHYGRRVNQITFFKHHSGDKFCLKITEGYECRVQTLSGAFNFLSCPNQLLIVTHSSGDFLRIGWRETEYSGHRNVTLDVADSKEPNFSVFKEEVLFV